MLNVEMPLLHTLKNPEYKRKNSKKFKEVNDWCDKNTEILNSKRINNKELKISKEEIKNQIRNLK